MELCNGHRESNKENVKNDISKAYHLTGQGGMERLTGRMATDQTGKETATITPDSTTSNSIFLIYCSFYEQRS